MQTPHNCKLSPPDRTPFPFIDTTSIETPAFLYDTRILQENLDALLKLDPSGQCDFLYSLKAACICNMVQTLMPGLAGLSVSSLFEARLARDLLGPEGVVHLTTPGIRPEEITELSDLCTAISFNSLGHFERYSKICEGKCSAGLRVNPGLSFVSDSRYDPCQTSSRLGVPVDLLRDRIDAQPDLSERIDGLHFHSNCESRSFSALLRTLRLLRDRLPDLVEKISWLNLGGGYLYREIEDPEAFADVADSLADAKCSVLFEPGSGVVNSAGFIISSVIDVFERDGKQIAVTDTTINHIPDAFDCQARINFLGKCADGPYEYILAGCTCLPGDLFGEYRFAKPLQAGDRLIATDVGAYTLVKANTFNGVNLPTVYRIDQNGDLSLERKFTYHEFAMRWQPSNAVESGGAP